MNKMINKLNACSSSDYRERLIVTVGEYNLSVMLFSHQT